MNSSFIRRSLAEVVAERLRADIRIGILASDIPGENCLAKEYAVARTTIRAALKKLEGEGLITPAAKGKNRTLVKNVSTQIGQGIRILPPSDLDDLDNYSRNYLSAIRREIEAVGLSVKMSPKGTSTEERGVDRLLKNLVKQFPADCWVLITPTSGVGQWFVDNGINCIACGGEPLEGLLRVCHDGVALTRHAMLTLFQNGHQRVLVVTRWPRIERSKVIAEIFKEGGVAFQKQLNLFNYRNDPDRLRERLLQLLNLKKERRPTALFLPDSRAVAVAYSVCVELGLKIPNDLSLIVSSTDSMLDNFFPRPCAYSVNTGELGRVMRSCLIQKLNEPEAALENKNLLLKYQKGGSLRDLSGGDTG